MMMNIINNLKHKFILLLLFGFSTLAYSFEGGDPPPPEGDGSPASPIDLYLIYLAVVAFFVIFYTYKKSIIIEKK